jgi:hypothetical protein
MWWQLGQSDDLVIVYASVEIWEWISLSWFASRIMCVWLIDCFVPSIYMKSAISYIYTEQNKDNVHVNK